MPKRKGVRELHNLSSSVNYEKWRENLRKGDQEGSSTRRRGRKGKGTMFGVQ